MSKIKKKTTTQKKTVPKLSKKKLKGIRSDVSDAYNNFEPALEKRALFKTSDVELGHDLVQDTFLKTLLYLQKGGKIIIMRGFLNHVLNDLIIDEYRKKKTTSLEVLLEKGFDHSFDSRERAMNIFDGQAVALLIPDLPKKYHRVMKMRYLQGLSLKEISVLTNQSQNTSAVQVHRGLNKLRTLYAESYK